MVEVTQEAFDAAKARGAELLQTPRAEAAPYDAARERVVVVLTTGIEFSFPGRKAEGLEGASADDLSAIELTPFGLGSHLPRRDADLSVAGLLKGVLGSERWMAGRRERAA